VVAHFNGVKSGQPAGKTLNTVLSGAAVVVRPLIKVCSDSAGVLACEHWVVLTSLLLEREGIPKGCYATG